ncbi:DMT family transporter [Gudongella oleilytica]|jgi:drug/metabolite transporter (DMT)-like permease|uniref:DMT family transporter n=2 Tax=Gudongella oleilytica TaxID=1582259 RepID=UPI0019D2685D|nr:DMT family transporter [Gudongella oleilytica]
MTNFGGDMKNKELKASLLLLLTAAIWGFAFVAQRKGMDYIGPFTYTGIRFLLGSLSLLPVIKLFGGRKESGNKGDTSKDIVKAGIIAGTVLFIAATFQQVGLQYTTAGKAGFITSLYIVIVPIMGLFMKQRSNAFIWIGAIVAAFGLYLLSINEDLTIQFGDLLQLIGAFFWAAHIIILGIVAKKLDPLKFSAVQFTVTGTWAIIAAFIFEDIQLGGIMDASIPLLYGGIFSAGIAYTIQAIAQKDAKTSHAAIALSMEAVFAAIGGAIILHERLPLKGYIGAGLMLAGMLISQADNFRKMPETK